MKGMKLGVIDVRIAGDASAVVRIWPPSDRS